MIELAAGCTAVLAVSAVASFGATVDDLVEFPEETEALVAATTAFFNEIENTTDNATKREPVFRLPEVAQRIKGYAPDAGAGELTRKGPVSHLTGYRINWYPVDRFLGSVDFMGTWNGNRNLVCGYLVWDMSMPQEPVLSTVTANFIDLNDFRGKQPAEIHEMLLESNCAFGAIDDNYAFFEPEG